MKKSIFLLDVQKTTELTNSIGNILKKIGVDSNINFLSIASCEDAIDKINNHDFYIVKGKSHRAGTQYQRCYSKEFINQISKGQDKAIILEIVDYADEIKYFPLMRKIEISQDTLLNGYENDLVTGLFSFILKPPVIHLSYGNEYSKNGKRDLINEIDNVIKLFYPNLVLIIDRKSLKNGENVSIFMDDIKESDNLVLLLNNKYFESKHCMNEITGFLKRNEKLEAEKILEKLFILVDKGAESIYSSTDFSLRYSFWTNELRDSANKIHTNHPTENSLKELEDIINTLKFGLPFFEKHIKNIKADMISDLTNSGFASLLNQINERIIKQGHTSFYSENFLLIEAISNRSPRFCIPIKTKENND